MKRLVRTGIPLQALRDDSLTAASLAPLRVITLENAVSMGATTAYMLAAWTRGGGTLITVPEAGSRDELGRPWPRSVLWDALGVMTPRTRAVGRGQVILVDAAKFTDTVEMITSSDQIRVSPGSAVEVIPYRMPGRLVVHVVRHEPTVGTVTLRLPPGMGAGDRATLHAPELAKPQALAITRTGGAVSIRIPDPPIYSVIAIE